MTKPRELIFKNDSNRLREELKEIADKNLPLYNLIEDVSKFVYSKYGINIVITMLYRTDQEQDDIYLNHIDPDKVIQYKKKKFKSPHQFYQAVDLRSRVFTQDQIKAIIEYLEKQYTDSNYYKWTAKAHDAGSGDHFHIQYYKAR